MENTKLTTQTHNCISCNAIMTGAFCSNCGEHRLDQSHRSVSYLLSDLVESFTSLENRLLKTIWSFFRYPGELSRNYSIGKRIEYMKPITFFLLVNLLYVLFTPITDFSVSFYDQLNSQVYSTFLKEWIDGYIASNNLNYQVISQEYKQVTAVLSRSLIILSTPLLAMFLTMIYHKKKVYFVDHLVFSIHYYAWIMAWIIIAQLPPYILNVLSKLTHIEFLSTLNYLSLLNVGLITFLALASKRAYQLTWLSVLIRLPFAFTALVISHFLYRLVQFIISFFVVVMDSNNLVS